MAADMASMSLQKAEELLQKASSWGIWDMLGGGFFSTMFKHNRMDEAQAAMNEARGHLRRLKRELLDVNLTGDLKMDVGSFLTFADYFFDGAAFVQLGQHAAGLALFAVFAAAAAIVIAFAHEKNLLAAARSGGRDFIRSMEAQGPTPLASSAFLQRYYMHIFIVL